MKTLLLTLFLGLSATLASAFESLPGNWLAISHQTVTVYAFRKDGTMSGTYFTPKFDVRTTFSGKWTLEKEALTIEFLESSEPIMKVPLVDRNRLEVIDKDTVVLHTLPSGISLEMKRIQFKKPKEVYGR
tara:strand:- start:6398 stop:6787 length:390 start_codon:yes stop_codon:yes gene_type:complete